MAARSFRRQMKKNVVKNAVRIHRNGDGTIRSMKRCKRYQKTPVTWKGPRSRQDHPRSGAWGGLAGAGAVRGPVMGGVPYTTGAPAGCREGREALFPFLDFGLFLRAVCDVDRLVDAEDVHRGTLPGLREASLDLLTDDDSPLEVGAAEQVVENAVDGAVVGLVMSSQPDSRQRS